MPPPTGKRRRRQHSSNIEFHELSDDDISQPEQAIHRHTEFASQNHRVSTHTTYIATAASPPRTPVPSETRADPELEHGASGDPLEGEYAAIDADFVHEIVDLEGLPKPRRRTAGDHPLREWVPLRDEWLAELLRHEGRNGFLFDKCPRCGEGVAEVKCDDCHDGNLYCNSCTIAMHKRNPFHHIKDWVKTHFRRKTLKEAGLRIQLGHSISQTCLNPQCAWADDFIVLDTGGVHSVGLDFCNCESAQPHHIQLLQAGLFPATSQNPKTAATFRLLQQFHTLSTQANVSGFQFYAALARRSDNTGVHTPKDRYPAFMRMIRQWRHLKMLKRAARGHDPEGVAGTTQGSCAVLCPACPHPGKNLPDDWKEAPPERSWLYRLFLGIDANFRLKRKKVSSDELDPGLNAGYAFFVEEKDFKEHIATFGAVIIEPPSTCNNHDTLKLANMKGAQGTAASGVGTVECARHDMKRPCSVGDLQKGERYVNMDYLFASSLDQNSPLVIVVSYDIVCQWSVHWWERMVQYGRPTWDFKNRRIIFLIPKFHLPAHRDLCQRTYSFNLTKYVGRTDGEAVERGWAAANPFSSSTKEMGPGSRRDLLDDVFGDYNWRKICILPSVLLAKVKAAVTERSEHTAAFAEFHSALPPEYTARWRQAVEKWEEDSKQPNPFEIRRKAVTQASVRLQLAEEDARQLQQGRMAPVHEQVTTSMLITSGLEIEEQQRRLQLDISALGQYATDLQRAKLLERRNALQRKFDSWAEIQHLYMPRVATMRSRLPAGSLDEAPPIQNTPLFLPSDIVDLFECDRGLADCEFRLRYAQAHDALEDMRRHLRLRSHLYHFKDRFVRGQRPNTRARSILLNVEDKIKADAARYRRAHTALHALKNFASDQFWQNELRLLEDADIRGMTEGLYGESEGRRTLSWIWRTPGVGQIDGSNQDEGVQEALRIEWCKSRARAQRWAEECELLEEEMRRVIAFHEYYAHYWLAQVGSAQARLTSDEHKEGLVAYAFRQAEVRLSMRDHCRHAWRFVGEWLRLGVCSAEEETATPDTTEF